MSNESTVKPKIEAKEWWLVLEHHKTPRVLFEKPDEIYETDVHVIEAQPALNRISELEAKVESLQADGLHTCHSKCQRIACVQRRKIANLEAIIAELEQKDKGTK